MAIRNISKLPLGFNSPKQRIVNFKLVLIEGYETLNDIKFFAKDYLSIENGGSIFLIICLKQYILFYFIIDFQNFEQNPLISQENLNLDKVLYNITYDLLEANSAKIVSGSFKFQNPNLPNFTKIRIEA